MKRSYVAPEIRVLNWPCPRDTNGDGDCGLPYCPDCGLVLRMLRLLDRAS